MGQFLEEFKKNGAKDKRFKETLVRIQETMARALCAMVADHAQRGAPAGRFDELAAKGRDVLAAEFGMGPEAIDELSADVQLCKALGRLAFVGATDPLLIRPMLRRPGSELWVAMRRALAPSDLKKQLESRGYYAFDEKLSAQTQDRISKALAEAAGGANRSHALRLAKFSTEASLDAALPLSVLPMAYMRMSLFALGAPGQWGAMAREAILAGTSTPSDPLAADPWEKVGPLGDVQNAALGMEGKRPLGAKNRGEAMREAFGDAHKIFQWRNPALLFRGLGNAVGARTLETARLEAEAFGAKGSMAMAAVASQISKFSGQRRALATALAERAAQGFAGLEEDPDLIDLLPGYEPSAGSEDLPDFKAGGLASDPMGKVALLAAKLHGLGSLDASGLVGEAKRALGEKNGLSGAGWKALAGNEELRELFAKAAQRSLGELRAPNRGSALGYGGVKKLAEDIMSSADASGRSAVSRLRSMAAKACSGMEIEAFAKSMSAGAASSVASEDLAEALRLVEASGGGALCALMAGMLPSLPKSAYESESSLTSAAGRIPLIVEDAKALEKLGPALLRGILARHKKHMKGTDIEAARARTLAMVADIADCAKGMQGGFWARLDPKDPVSHALRMHEEWVANLRAADVDADQAMRLKWAPLVGSDAMGRATAQELLSGRELHEEGEIMRHCVSSYAGKCREGASRIVSLRLDGARSSTLELAPCDARGLQFQALDFSDIEARGKVKSWKVVQHRGKCNAQVVHKDLLAFAEEIASRAQAGFEATTEKLAKKLAEQKAAEKAEKAAGVRASL
jgi:hypothetical protein